MGKTKDHIMTYSGIKVDPFNIRAEDVNIVDIAHSLSMMTRANGHFKSFYSVAQHSINCAVEAKRRGLSSRVQLACLLHDASEAYIADIPRPVKHRLVGYDVLEKNVSDVIFSVFELWDITSDETLCVTEIDDAILYYEFDEFMDMKLSKEEPYISSSHDFSCKDISAVYNDFLCAFAELSKPKESRKESEIMKVVGVDGCRGGWIACIIDRDGPASKVYKSIEELCNDNDDASLIIIDMPIGLPEEKDDIRPDSAARKILKGKASSIFNCPCRQAIYVKSYEEANEKNKRVLGKGLSKQSYAISSKIKEIDVFLTENPRYRSMLVESHPEVCFAVLNGKPVMEKKSTAEGASIRLRILSEYQNGLYDTVAQTIYTKNILQTDDIVDAICLAVVAKLGQFEKLTTVPKNPQKDMRGFLMQMVIPTRGNSDV